MQALPVRVSAGAARAVRKKLAARTTISYRRPIADRSCPRSLAHRAEAFRRDLNEHPLLTGTSKRILVLVEILFGHLVDVLLGAVLRDLGDPSPDLQVAIWIIGIDERDGNAGIVADVLVLLAAERGVDNHLSVFEIDPDRRGLRAAVGHEGGEAAECGFLEQIFIAVGEGSCHDESPAMNLTFVALARRRIGFQNIVSGAIEFARSQRRQPCAGYNP